MNNQDGKQGWLKRQIAASRSWYTNGRMDLWIPAIVLSISQIIVPLLLLSAFIYSERGYSLTQGTYETRVILKGFAGYVIMCVGVVFSGGAMKAAIEATKDVGRPPVIVASLLLAIYLLVASVWFAIGTPLRELPGTASTVLVFYFAIYLLFAGWTVKPTWDVLTDARKNVILKRSKPKAGTSAGQST